MTTYPCGCVNEAHEPTGALFSVSKCAHHRAMQRDPRTLDEAYYRELGVIGDGKEQANPHFDELVEALGTFPAPTHPKALEIGCGVSPYYWALRSAGYKYLGIDPCEWAANFMWDGSIAPVLVGDFETAKFDEEFDFILAAHCFEHMADAPAAIAKAASLLAKGQLWSESLQINAVAAGELWIVIPDDSDPVNPDHMWFFSPESLRKAVELAGLKVLTLASRRYIERENFLYLRAVKP